MNMGFSPDDSTAQKGALHDEEGIFRALDLAYIPPELREDCGEFEVATRGRMPRLLEWTDMKGSLHNHSNWSDGRQPLEAIIDDCMEHGFEYWAVTDHSTSSFQANGLKPPRLLDQIKAIRALNEKLSRENIDFRLLTGSEVDILSDGSLDFEDDLLAQLDVVVASIHQGFTQTKDQLTERLIMAAHPQCTCSVISAVDYWRGCLQHRSSSHSDSTPNQTLMNSTPTPMSEHGLAV